MAIADQIKATGGKQIGGWYDNPRTGRNERYWGTIENQEIWTDNPDLNWNDIVSRVEQRMQPQRTAEDYMRSATEQVRQMTEKLAGDRYANINEYLKNNPLGLDEAFLQETRKIVTQQVQQEPYFAEKLNNYLEEVDLIKERSNEDQNLILDRLNEQESKYLTTEKTQYQRARENALQGLVDRDLIETGAGRREANIQEITRENRLEDYLQGNEQTREDTRRETERRLSDLDRQTEKFETELEREKRLRIESEIENRKNEELQRQKMDFVNATGANANDYSAYFGG